MSPSSEAAVYITEVSLDVLRRLAQRAPGSLFAILDACDEPLVPPKVRELGEERAVSLYRGKAERDYWAIAPYLVQVDEQLFDWIVDNLWEDPWGVFAVAATDLESLRKHFRRFLIVENEQAEQMYFRFYDPRVLPSFLERCDVEQTRTFFGPITQLYAPCGPSQVIQLELAKGCAAPLREDCR